MSRRLAAALFDEFCQSGDRVLALGRRFSEFQHTIAQAEPDRVRLPRTDTAVAEHVLCR